MMSLNVLRDAYMRHVSFSETEEMSNQWGSLFYTSWARDNWWLSVSPPIEEDASPFKGCVAAKFLYEDGADIVIRKITFDPEEASAAGVFWGSSDRINAKRRTFIRASLPSIVGEMLDSTAWHPADGKFDRPELIDKISGTYAAMMAARKVNLEFTWHDSVMEAYRSWHDVSTSCMTGEDRYENTELYDNCVGGKRIWALEVRDASSTLIGRALVFKPIRHRTVEEILNEPAIDSTDVPFKENAEDWYVHRIYGAGAYAGSDYDGARRVSGEIMKAYPWLKHEVSGVACIVCRIPRSQRLPYIDNSGFFLVRNQDPNSKIIICFGAKPSETGGWEKESGGNYQGGFIYEERHSVCCSDCDERMDNDDATYVNDRPVCNGCLESYTWCEITEEYCSNEDAIEIVAGRDAGSYIDMNCLPYTRRGVTYEIADTPDGRSVAAPSENISMVFSDGEDKAMVLDSDDTENIMTAKVIRPAFNARGYLSSDFVVTDEEIDVLVEGSRSNYCWKDADDNWYVYRDGIPFNGVVRVVRDDDVVRFFTETGPRQIVFRPHGGRNGLIPLSMDFWEQTTPCEDVRVKPNWLFCITDPKDDVWHVSLTCVQFEVPNAHSLTANVRTSNLGYCIVNDDRSGQCRLLKVGMSPNTDAWEIERICKSMFRSGRFGAGDYCIKHIPNTHEYEVTSPTGHMMFGESKLIVNADSIMEVS